MSEKRVRWVIGLSTLLASILGTAAILLAFPGAQVAEAGNDPHKSEVAVTDEVSKICDGPNLIYIGRDGKGGIAVAAIPDAKECS